ncbi:unnamed protein product [Rhizoctonia solani]|uniref:Thiamin pyrophosphokinase thiamin-binding domain-containing protein n=1 Tax=Rhizoctonia solani TaxID=456999 RepID=A0A8H3B3S7_9AGAM|nr:unnamed protein product [Rhizoctonia solani]
MTVSQTTCIWDTSFLDPGAESRNPLALIVLNQPFTLATFTELWVKCQWKIFADGGSNRVYDAFGSEERLRYLPHYIKGDMDSIRPEVRSWYAEQGVRVESVEDQDSTDLMKCIAWVDQVERNQKVKGHHQIELNLQFVGPTCGLLPVGIASSVLTTTGLKWNLDAAESSFDGLVSTSNSILPVSNAESAGRVTIETTEPIWWCVENKRAGQGTNVRGEDSGP